MRITKVWFEGDRLFGMDETGATHSQSLLWYKRLHSATVEERARYTISSCGIHWRGLDEDVSFESFGYDDAAVSQPLRSGAGLYCAASFV